MIAEITDCSFAFYKINEILEISSRLWEVPPYPLATVSIQRTRIYITDSSLAVALMEHTVTRGLMGHLEIYHLNNVNAIKIIDTQRTIAKITYKFVVIIVPSDALAAVGVRATAGTVMN